MKQWLTAAALAPILVACASAAASDGARFDEDGVRVLIVNGERIELGETRDAAAAIEQAIERSGDRRVEVHMELDEADIWSDAEREAFAEAMAALASGMAEDAMIVAFGASSGFDFDFDFDHDVDFDGEMSEAEARAHAERAEARAERHAERLERHAERLARNAERLAMRAEADGRAAEAFGRRMELQGLRAGVHGMERGLEGIEEGLRRGWVYDGGERRDLTAEDRAELEEAREELETGLEEMRARLAEATERAGEDGRREVRVVRRDDHVRAWVNGEEVTGSELDRLLQEEGRLAGAPTPPEPPQPD